jgi:cytochrome c
MRHASLCFCALAASWLLAIGMANAQLRGHGGPVRALAVSPDGKILISGSFDTSAIRWSLPRGAAEDVLRFHDGAVNAVVLLQGGAAATGGEDARIAIWSPGERMPRTVLEGHQAPVVALAASRDGRFLASASWDHTARLWAVGGGAPRLLAGHSQNVNGIAFTPDGRAVVTAGYDATLRIWPLSGDDTPLIAALPTPLNAVAIAADGEIITAGADGKIYLLSATGDRRSDIAAEGAPVVAIALSGDGRRIAAASVRGSITVLDRVARRIERTLIGPGTPVWSVVFLPDNRTLLAGGADRMIRRWDTVTGEPVDGVAAGYIDDPLAAYAGDPGAEVFRACIACHALDPDGGNRAGPTLAGIFGRRIATLPGYNFSAALKALDIVWTPDTVSRLFEIGPAAYTPGTKMPEQRIGSAADRAALVHFLARATAR